MRRIEYSFLHAFIAIAMLAGAPAGAQSTATSEFNLPAQSLGDSLRAVGRQLDVNVLFDPARIEGLTAPAIKLRGTFEQALTRLLVGSGFTYKFLNERTVVLSAGEAAASDSVPAHSASDRGEQSRIARTDPARSMQHVESGSDESAARTGSQAASRDSAIEEIVVSAQKRVERLQDVPVPVSAISASTLVDRNQLRLQDYYASIPSLDLTVDNRGAPALSIRGITMGSYANPTVSLTVDDVPFGASTYSAYSWAAVDIDPNELARVEVLRGPQGTLYGASSIGGLIKYVTVDPSSDGFAARVQGGLSGISGSGEAGYNASASVNAPLSETFAVRLSGFTRRDPGYIDNVLTGERDVNELDVHGGRLVGLWRPSDAVSLKLSALMQRSELHGSPFVDVADGSGAVPADIGDLQQSDIRDSGGYDRRLQAYSALFNARLGNVQITSVSGYNVNEYTDSFDLTYLFGAYTQPIYGVPGVAWAEHNRTNKFSQEVRVSVPMGERFEWLLGAFYTRESTDLNGGWVAADPLSGEYAGSWLQQLGDVSYREYSAFADLTIRFTERFDVQIGGRESRHRQTYEQTAIGPYVGTFLGRASPFVTQTSPTTANAFTYLLTPRLRLTPELMIYARFASGYRPGGPNPGVASNIGLPVGYSPDKTQNYELGLKGDFLDRRLTLDASAYYIDWSDIQLTLVDQTFANYIANVSQAKSTGVELSATVRPARGLTVSAWITSGRAELTDDVPASATVYGFAGDRLPYSSRFSGSLSVSQEFPVASATGFVDGLLSYVGERFGEYASIYGPTVRQRFPAYAKTGLRAGLRKDTWSYNLFVDNVFDRRGQLSGGVGYYPPFAFQYVQPRSFGLNVAKTF